MRPRLAVSGRGAIAATALSFAAIASVSAQLQSPVTVAPAGADRLPPAGAWHFGVGFGTVAYGSESVCACSAFTVDVAGGYEGAGGFGTEYQLALTQTTGPLLDQRINLFLYPRFGHLGRAFGVYAGAGLLNQTEGNNARGRGFAYGYGVRARAPLGGRGRTHIFADVGVSTARERFVFDRDWRGREFEQLQVHSGLRIRIGVVW